MKILAFIGSPRRGGNTDILVNKVLEGAQEKGAETKVFYLNDMNIKGCQACDTCIKYDRDCAVKDDMHLLYNEIHDAECIVIGSPIYFGSVSAQTKAFIDRWQAFLKPNYLSLMMERKNPSRLKEGKKILFILSQQLPNDQLYIHAVKSIENSLAMVAHTNKTVSIIFPGLDEKSDALKNKEFLERAKNAGINLTK